MELFVDQEFRNLIPPLEASEKALLEESILEEGVRDAIVTWNGYIVDGHNRYDIITKHGIKDYRVVNKKFADKDEAKIWIMKNQIGRRNVSAYLRSEYIFQVDQWEESRKIGQNKMKNPFRNCEKGHINTTQDLASKLNVHMSTASRIIQIHEKAPEELKAKCRTGEVSTNEAYKEIKRAEKEANRQRQLEEIKARTVDIPHDNHVKFYCADFSSANIPDNSIDHIFTDPPYKAEYLELWTELGETAARVLKPGGLCITYSGTFHLPEIIFRLSEHLTYYWQFILLHKGIWQRINARHLTTGYKPILVFAKSPLQKPLNDTWDIVEGSGREKHLHHWSQSEGEAEEILKRLTYEGQTILDPFAGTGTIAMACRNTNRLNISYEIDEETYKVALGRLSQ